MTQHTDLIERLRDSAATGLDSEAADQAANALEAQAREIAELRAQESELCTLYGLAEAECKKLRAEVEGLRESLQKANAEGAHFGLAPITPPVPEVERSIPKFHFGRVEEALKNVPRKKGQP